jgi:tRNA dimethylallyltransferase
MKKIAVLSGPTASGKTGLAIQLARAARERGVTIEIVNADSLLVYRGMDIGTAKPSFEERAGIAHHLIDIREPDEPYSAGDFVRDAEEAFAEITARGAHPLVVGGSGFYLKALLRGLWEGERPDPALRDAIRDELEGQSNAELLEALRARDPVFAARTQPTDRYRLLRANELLRLGGGLPSVLEAQAAERPADPRFELWILDRPNEELERRIALRTREMIANGLLDEVARVQARAPSARCLASVGYAQALAFLDGRRPAGRKPKPGLPGLEEEIRLATRQLVKRQRTWFRGQTEGSWFDPENPESLADLTRRFHTIYI